MQVEKSSNSIPKPRYILIVDHRHCRGCGLCELVCSILREGEARPTVSRIRVEKDRENYEFKPSVCMQCVIPKCMMACTVGAIKVEGNTGARIIVEDLCVNCGLCAKACPFTLEMNTIFQHPSKSVYIKCDLCYWRNNGPACVEVCPTQAIILRKIGR